IVLIVVDECGEFIKLTGEVISLPGWKAAYGLHKVVSCDPARSGTPPAERHDLSHRAPVPGHRQGLAGFDPPQHRRTVVAHFSLTNCSTHITECSRNMLQP